MLSTSGYLKVNREAVRSLLRALGYPLVPTPTITPTFVHECWDDDVDQEDPHYLRRLTLSEELRMYEEDVK